MNKCEILAPVGSSESLRAAVLSGADAVYFGMGKFNARRNAKGLDGDLKAAISYCHSRGVKVHITLNTLIKD
nr:U32 family peptidase [Clostridiales bacterium]